MGKIRELFMKFWADNIKTNYKKISIACGTGINMIIGAVLGFCMEAAYSMGNSLGMTIVMILFAIQVVTNVIVFSIFGKATNGNGYNMPETKLIVDVIRENQELRDSVKAAINKKINNDSHILNGD